jgi:hypothetical protein
MEVSSCQRWVIRRPRRDRRPPTACACGRPAARARASPPPARPTPILVLSAPTGRPRTSSRASTTHRKTIREVRYRDASTLDASTKYLQRAPGRPDARRRPDQQHLRPPRRHRPADAATATSTTSGSTRSCSGSSRACARSTSTSSSSRTRSSTTARRATASSTRRSAGRRSSTSCSPRWTSSLTSSGMSRRRRRRGGGDVKWVGQLQPRGNLVCKEVDGALGDRRIADLSRWFEVASEALRRRTTCTWTLSPSVHCLCDECLEGVRL